MVKEEKVSS